jgi:hypothetical protein
MLNVYNLFLKSMTDQLPELMTLLGDDWFLFRKRLLEEATVSTVNSEDASVSESRVATTIIGLANNGPAEDFVGRLMIAAAAAANHTSAETRSGRKVRGGRRQSYAPAAEVPATEVVTNLVKRINTVSLRDAHLEGALDFGEASVSAYPDPHSENAPPSREIVITSHTSTGQSTSKFAQGERYILRLSVNFPTNLNLAEGDTAISDIPEGGLNTYWVVTSTNVELITLPATCRVDKVGQTWVGRFDLHIPEKDPSEVKEISFLGNENGGALLITIYAVGRDGVRELYRELTVSLAGQPIVTLDETSKVANQTNLETAHEWTTPPVHIQVSIKNGVADVSTKRYQLELYEFFEPFDASVALIASSIKNVRDSLERFREHHSDYLEDLDHPEMETRLKNGHWKPYSWDAQSSVVDPQHTDAFLRVQKSEEWRNLADDGYALFDKCFPEGTRLRSLFSTLPTGSRIDFHWSPQSGPGFVSHVPWALMHMKRVDVTGVDLAQPTDFCGLRFRISARSWIVQNGSVVLGNPQSASSVNMLYWGRQSGDDVGTEADWQASELAKLKSTSILPLPGGTSLKGQIVQAIDTPSPAPVAVIYFYCHCSVGDGGQPCLRFGNTSKSQDVLTRNDLSKRRIPDGPLVFANACSTSQSDPFLTSDLEQTFFDRGVRAFIGTEAKVPIKLASKFAWFYFQLFSRQADPDPIAAGEALSQSRLFLWTQYKNVGGLFYSMSNQYDLYFASSEEVLALRGRKA